MTETPLNLSGFGEKIPWQDKTPETNNVQTNGKSTSLQVQAEKKWRLRKSLIKGLNLSFNNIAWQDKTPRQTIFKQTDNPQAYYKHETDA